MLVLFLLLFLLGAGRVKTKNKTNPGLGRWVSAQRHEYRRFINGERSILCQERIDRLNAIGFTWSCLDEDAEAKAGGGVDGGNGTVDGGGVVGSAWKSAEPSSPPPKGRPMPPKVKSPKQQGEGGETNDTTSGDDSDTVIRYQNFDYFGRPIPPEANDTSSIYDDNEEDRDRFQVGIHGESNEALEEESSDDEMDDGDGDGNNGDGEAGSEA